MESDYLRHAYRLAEMYSDDRDTKNGAVLISADGNVIGVGVNCFPQGVNITPERLERPTKYAFMEHAERNAIYDACRRGESTLGSTMYCPWITCADCARAIIGAGIMEVVGHKQFCDRANIDRWKVSITYGFDMLREAGVGVRFYDGFIGDVEALFNGEVWRP